MAPGKEDTPSQAYGPMELIGVGFETPAYQAFWVK